jgi:hypothetical protein
MIEMKYISVTGHDREMVDGCAEIMCPLRIYENALVELGFTPRYVYHEDEVFNQINEFEKNVITVISLKERRWYEISDDNNFTGSSFDDEYFLRRYKLKQLD